MPAEELVRDVMAREVVTVPHWTSVREFIELSEEEGISGAPVVDADDWVVGVVSVTDVIRALRGAVREKLEDEEAGDAPPGAEEAGRREEPVSAFFRSPSGDLPRGRLGIRSGALGDHAIPGTVGEIMTRATVSVDGDSGVTAAAGFLTRADVHRALVFEGGRLAGIITINDLLAAFLRATDHSSAPEPGIEER